MASKYPLSREDYFIYSHYSQHRRSITNVQKLVEVLDCLRRGFFHYKCPITESELIQISADESNSYYKEFSIEKRHGGKRFISAPNNRLKEIQNCIRILLTGFKFRGKSITTCATPHIGQEVVYNLDIKDFYASINASQILQKLIKEGFNYKVARLISSLVTFYSKEGVPVLPQGAPSSAVVADLVVEHLDARLRGFAAKHDISYSRYADDITFSCSKSSPWYNYSKTFRKIIKTEGFTVNKRKTRVSFYYQKQEVLGITVNSRLNVSTRYIKQLRTVIHNWEKDGYINANNKFLLCYFKNNGNIRERVPRIECFVAGKLSYLKMVRNVQSKEKGIDSVWKKLHDRYVALRIRDYNIITGNKDCFEKKIYRYGDDGPLVYAIRGGVYPNWKIIKILGDDGRWFEGSEIDAYRLGYGDTEDLL